MKNKHTHKYVRSILGWKTKSNKKYIFKCSIPGCSHYVPLYLAEGKWCICHRCGEPFVMTKFQLSLKKPHCVACTKSKSRENVDRLKQLLEATDLLKVMDK